MYDIQELTTMLQELLNGSLILDLPVVTMLFFIAVFGLVLARALSRRRSQHYQQMAQLPLDDGTTPMIPRNKEVRS